MGADALTKVPNADHTRMVTTDELALIGVNDHIIDRSSVNVITLQATRTSVPNLHSPIFRAGNHPFPFTVKRNSGNVVGVTFKRDHRVRVGRFDIEELHIVMTCSC